MSALLRRIAAAGSVFTAAMVVLVLTEARLGTPIFFACAAAASLAYVSMLALIWRGAVPPVPPILPVPPLLPVRPFVLALGFALLFRAILATSPIGPGNDMFRYIWDGRIQRLGYNPYAVLPSDPALAAIHADDTTRLMPSRNSRTPYPPAAELVFRLVVTVSESVYFMRSVMVLFDLLTIFFIWRWLQVTGRSEWLTLAYAWNPLVVLENAFSGHVDALCMMWIAACAYMLARRRTALASSAFALAVASKLLPIVLVPLLWGRIRVRDAALGVVWLILLYLPFSSGSNPFIEVTKVVDQIRFNGPLFLAIIQVTTPKVAAAVALLAGLAVAAFCRFRLAPDDPAAWAWPMAASLAFAPVVYPWYLLSLAPFLLLPATLPLAVWTLTVMSVYVVWELAMSGAPWVVPTLVLFLEYGVVLAAAVVAPVVATNVVQAFRPAGRTT